MHTNMYASLLCPSCILKPHCAAAFGRRAPLRSWRTTDCDRLLNCSFSEPQLTSQRKYGSRSSASQQSSIICQAQKQEDKEKDIVGGIDINQEGDIWEGEAIGIAVKVSCNITKGHLATCMLHFSVCVLYTMM